MFSSRHILSIFAFFLAINLTVLPAQTVREQIDDILLDSSVDGNSWGILVENESGTQVIYDRNPDLFLAPASNTKMFTTAAAFDLLGTDYAFETKVYYTGTLSASGVVSGDLVLIAEHDPTWNSHVLSNYYSAFDYLAQQLKAEGLNSISGNVRVYGAGLTNYGSTSILTNLNNQPTWNEEVADEMIKSLEFFGTPVDGIAVGQSGFTAPSGSTLFHTHRSDELTRGGRPLTLEVLAIPLNERSSNPMAELILRHMGWKLRGSDSFSAGATEVTAWLRDTVGLDETDQIVMNDGSGLSWNNRFSARQTVELTRWMQPNFPTWGATLPVGCSTGTIASRFCGTVGSGNVHAKTGSLSISIALSGWIDNPNDGERYFFSFLTNRSSIDQTSSRSVIDEAVVALGQEGITLEPELQTVTFNDQNKPVLEFTSAGDVSGYRVYTSNDGLSNGSFIDIEAPSTYIIETRSGGLNVGDYTEFGSFQDSSSHSNAAGLTSNIGSRFALPGDENGANDRVRFQPSSLSAGTYNVSVTCFNFASANAENVTARFVDASGTHTSTFDLTSITAGNTWFDIGTFTFEEGAEHFVEIDNSTQSNIGSISDSRMNVAAIRFSPSGNVTWTDAGYTSGARFYRIASLDGTTPGRLSDQYGIQSGSGSTVLIVDGNDRWNGQTENTSNENHSFATMIGRVFPSSVRFETVANEAVVDGLVSLDDYAAVLYLLGEESTVDETFSTAEQALVQSYLQNNNVGLLASGAEIGWDLVDQGSAVDIAFYENTLLLSYISDSSGITNAVPTADPLFAGLGSLDFNGGAMDIGYPDVLGSVSPSTVAMTYGSGSDGAAVKYDGAYRVVGLGFPLENAASESLRGAYLERIINFLVADVEPTDAWLLF